MYDVTVAQYIYIYIHGCRKYNSFLLGGKKDSLYIMTYGLKLLEEKCRRNIVYNWAKIAYYQTNWVNFGAWTHIILKACKK